MPIDLLSTVKGALTPDTISTISNKLGESPDAIQKAFGAGIPALLSGIMSKVSGGGAGSVLSLFVPGGADASILQNFSSLAGSSGASSLADRGKNIVQSIFGDKAPAVANAIGAHAGISSSSAASVLSMAAPLTLGGISSALPGGVNASSLYELLASQKNSILSALPAGLAGIAGLGGIAARISSLGSAAANKLGTAVPPAPAGGMKMWPIVALLAVLIIGGLIWYFAHSNAAQNAANTASNAASAVANTASNAAASAGNAASSAFAALGDLFPRKLPNGVSISIPKLGVENKLLDYLDSNATPDDHTWFDFDRLLFDSGSATLQAASGPQLEAVAAILNAYPKVKMRIGGYTDNTGNESANLKLSQERADSVMQALVGKGVDASRLSAKGYGEEHPVADNSTPEGRQKNRRISMRVTEK
jgi:outer membrane protein OmpA-like peptidoglycan-associated protein